jgi:hypothetical protein
MTLLRKWWAPIRARLIDDWRRSWRFWSVRLSFVGLAWSFVGAAFPGFALDAWNALPDELRSLMPQHIARIIATIIFAAAMAARLFKQKDKSDGD